MRIKYLFLGVSCGILIFMTGCSAIINDMLQPINVSEPSEEITLNSETNIEQTTSVKQPGTTIESTTDDAYPKKLTLDELKSKIKEYEFKYESTNNIPSHLIYKIEGKEIDYKYNDEGQDIMRKLQLPDIKYISDDDIYLHYSNEDIDWRLDEYIVTFSPENYEIINRSQIFAGLCLKALNNNFNENNQLAGICVNDDAEEVFKLYGKADNIVIGSSESFNLTYSNVWLGNVLSDITFEISTELKVIRISVDINIYELDAMDEIKSKSTHVSLNAKEVSANDVNALYSDLNNMIINTVINESSFDLNLATRDVIENVFKDISVFKDYGKFVDYMTGAGSYLTVYNEKDSWRFTINGEDFKNCSINEITFGATKKDVIDAFGPYYCDSNGGADNDYWVMSYNYKTEAGLKKINFYYSTTTNQILGFDFWYN